MIQYFCQIWVDITDMYRQSRIIIVAICLLIGGAIIGVIAVGSDSTVVVETACGQYVVLIVAEGSVLGIFLRLTVDALVLCAVLWLLSLCEIFNYSKCAVLFYLGYFLGVCLHTIMVLYGVIATIFVGTVLLLYILSLCCAVLLSFCNCCCLYGCRSTVDGRWALNCNINSVILIFGVVLAFLLLIFIFVRPLCGFI